VKVQEDSEEGKQSSHPDEQQKRERLLPQKAYHLHNQSKNQQNSRGTESPLDSNIAHAHGVGLQNFTLACSPTLCTTSWQPLVMQEVSLLLSESRIALWIALLSNVRAPRWQ
jgi:hypothetical protein